MYTTYTDIRTISYIVHQLPVCTYIVPSCDFVVSFDVCFVSHSHSVPVINGGWSGWRVVGVCSATCGGGQLRYERRCDNPRPQNGGRPCPGSDNKLEPCNTQCCPGGSTNPSHKSCDF